MFRMVIVTTLVTPIALKFSFQRLGIRGQTKAGRLCVPRARPGSQAPPQEGEAEKGEG